MEERLFSKSRVCRTAEANASQRIREAAAQLFGADALRLDQRTDILFLWVLTLEWLLLIGFAVFVAPKIWRNEESLGALHVHVALWLGALTILPSLISVVKSHGRLSSRLVISFSQVFLSVFFVHLSRGRVEGHFHVLVSLALLALYKDWRVLLLATSLFSLDHLFRGNFWPESIYGLSSISMVRSLEHVGWIGFLSFVFFYSIAKDQAALRSNSFKRAELEDLILEANDATSARVLELNESRELVSEQNRAILATSRMSALGEMATGIAHEVNNPLAIIRTLAAQIEGHLLDESKPVSRLAFATRAKKVIDAADRISRVVQGLRTFSRESNSPALVEIKTQSLLEETLSFCRERFRVAGIEILIEGENVEFQGRQTEISQVLLNLLNNSYDALRGKSASWVKISTATVSGFVVFRVTDSGRIDQPIRMKLFEPFFTTKGLGSGSGIGLSVSLGIARSNGGDLLLDETVPTTCFLFKLPLREGREKKALDVA